MSISGDQRRKQLRARDGRMRRNRAAQDRARAAMYAEIERVYAEGRDGEALLDAAARKTASARAQADPLKLGASGKRRKARRAQEAERSELQRKAENLSNLFHRKTIDAKMLRAALEIRDLMLIVTGGMQAMDWIRERVDGGKLPTDMIGGGAYAAECELRHVVRKSGMGDLAAEVVLRVAGMDESLKAVAIDFERRPKHRAAKSCAADTQMHVTALLCEGLAAAHRVLFPKNQSPEERAYRILIRAWTSGDITTDRPDIRQSDPRFKTAS